MCCSGILLELAQLFTEARVQGNRFSTNKNLFILPSAFNLKISFLFSLLNLNSSKIKKSAAPIFLSEHKASSTLEHKLTL